MKTNTLLKWLLAAIVCVTVVAGCNDSGPSTQIYVKKGTGQKMRIAVLPFDSVAVNQDAGRVITNTVVTYLLSTGYVDVVEPGMVSAAMLQAGVRTTDGMTPDTSRKLQPMLNVDAYVMGVVEEYGDVRIGSDTYPGVSFSARLVDADSNEIVWAATISKTGAEQAKIFDIGRISSLGKLTKLAVKAMADSLIKSKKDILAGNNISAETPQRMGPAAQGSSGGTGATTAPADTGAPAKYMDETPAYGEKELTAMLTDIDTAKVGAITYKKHYNDSVEAKYTIASGKVIEVKLVDYKKAAIASKFVQQEHAGSSQGMFHGLSASTGTSQFAYYHLDIAAGRFGLFVAGPDALKSDIETLSSGILDSLK